MRRADGTNCTQIFWGTLSPLKSCVFVFWGCSKSGPAGTRITKPTKKKPRNKIGSLFGVYEWYRCFLPRFWRKKVEGQVKHFEPESVGGGQILCHIIHPFNCVRHSFLGPSRKVGTTKVGTKLKFGTKVGTSGKTFEFSGISLCFHKDRRDEEGRDKSKI